MDQFNNLSVDAKVVYLLSLSESIIPNISQSAGYKIAVESLEEAWKWVKFKNIEAHNLYLYLENMDEQDIMTYTQLEDDCDKEKVWICIGNALAYIIREAYHYEKESYLPQTIESVDDETIESFIANFKKVYRDNCLAEELLHYLHTNYPRESDKEVDIKLIKAFIHNLNEHGNI
ncbi:Imm6 family immunity protein [Priestia endophytica]|jgi:hypothetical protein|uniref:Imm6 family immunity protein n=1 Tax=Priestia endophytica TaxID=135735 RepID=UPI003D29B7FE